MFFHRANGCGLLVFITPGSQTLVDLSYFGNEYLPSRSSSRLLPNTLVALPVRTTVEKLSWYLALVSTMPFRPILGLCNAIKSPIPTHCLPSFMSLVTVHQLAQGNTARRLATSQAGLQGEGSISLGNILSWLDEWMNFEHSRLSSWRLV